MRRLRSSVSGAALRSPAAPVHEVVGAEAAATSPGSVSVIASDGVPLHVRVDGDPSAPVTVVLAHGYLADHDFWLLQRASLAHHARVITYDHRGHGRSPLGGLHSLTIDQLGGDLAAVLDQAVPAGPVVVIGHSMGGMAILALAEQRPDLFGQRIAGVGLVTTAAAPVNGGAVLSPRAANRVLSAIDRLRLTSVSCHALRGGARTVARACAFASRMPPSVVDFVLQLTRSNPAHALVTMIPQFLTLDKRAALPVLGAVATLVVGAERDATIAPAHSTAIAEAIPGAHFEVIPNAGHLLPVEHPEALDELLHGLVTQATTRHAESSSPA